MESFQEIKPPTLRDMVLERVRSDIVTGHSGPGTMFSVPTLAADLGVSTTPVREALLELSNVGMLAPMRNRGFRVVATSLDDLKNLFAIRELLERFAAEAAAKRRVTETAPLRVLADAIGDAVKREDVRGYLEADRAFHQLFAAGAGNPRLAKMIMDLRSGMRLFGIESAAGRNRQVASVAEHYQLIEHAAAGEVSAIGTLISRHIMDWEPVFTAAVEGREQRTPLHRSLRRPL